MSGKYSNLIFIIALDSCLSLPYARSSTNKKENILSQRALQHKNIRKSPRADGRGCRVQRRKSEC